MTYPRRSRAAFLSAILTLLALNAGLAIVMHLRPALRDPLYFSKEELLVAHQARHGPDPLTVVALGSSRTANAFHPPTFETGLSASTDRSTAAFNLALPGSGALTQLLHLHRLLASGLRPDLLIVEVNPAMLDGPETRFLRPDRITHSELETLTAVGFADDLYQADWWKTNLNPWFGFRFQILGRLQKKWTPPGVPMMAKGFPDPTGWGPWRETITPEIYAARLVVARQEHFQTLQDLRIHPVPRAALAEIMAICNREGIPVVALLTPEGSEFRSWYGLNTERVMENYLSEVRAMTGVRVVDARDWLPDSAFVDGHHVHESAAAGFTSRLVREVADPEVLGADLLHSPGR